MPNSEQSLSEPKEVKYELGALLGGINGLADHHNLPWSESVALSGVVLEGGTLTLTSFEKACANIGLNAQRKKRRPSQVPSVVCPFVVFFKSGDVGVVRERVNGTKKLLVSIAGHSKSMKMSGRQIDKETLGTVIYAAPILKGPDTDFDVPKNDNNSKQGHWLWATVGRFWGSWVQVAVAALFVNLLGLALPLFVMNVYDRVIPYNAIPTLWALAGGVVLALFFDFLLRMTRSVVIDRSGRRIDMKVSSNIFRQAVGIRMDKRPARSGDVANQIREFESVRDFFTSASLSALIDLVFVGLFLYALWWLVGPLALVPLAAVPVVLIITMLVQIPLGRSVQRGLLSANNRHSVLIESMVGIETVKAISAEGIFQQRWDQAVAESVRATSSSRFWSSLAIFMTMTIQQGVSVVIIVWGVYLVAAGDISVGALIASNILAGRVLAPLGGIAMTLSRLQQSLMSYRGLNRLMALDRDGGEPGAMAAPVATGRLELRDASFSYPGNSSEVLKKLSLSINPGERVGLIGRVGSGKSTFGKVLCGLFQSSNGAILLDDVDIKHRHIADLRKSVSYVGQEPDLFSGTIRENILLAGRVDETAYEKACFVSGVASLVQTMALGYQTQVGERGSALSGGQRQAIALARALVSNPKILFLDEPTSAMDAATETTFVQAMKKSAAHSYSLIIATHRMSLLELVDRVIVLDEGRVVADGPRKEILADLTARKKRAKNRTSVTSAKESKAN